MCCDCHQCTVPKLIMAFIAEALTHASDFCHSNQRAIVLLAVNTDFNEERVFDVPANSYADAQE